jgi:hypothetical protein
MANRRALAEALGRPRQRRRHILDQQKRQSCR